MLKKIISIIFISINIPFIKYPSIIVKSHSSSAITDAVALLFLKKLTSPKVSLWFTFPKIIFFPSFSILLMVNY